MVLYGNCIVMNYSVFWPFGVQIIKNGHMIRYTFEISNFRAVLDAALASFLIKRYLSPHAQVLRLLNAFVLVCPELVLDKVKLLHAHRCFVLEVCLLGSVILPH